MYRDIHRETRPVVIVPDHHAEFTRKLIEKPGTFFLEAARTVVRRTERRGFLGIGRKVEAREVKETDRIEHDMVAEAISARIGPKAYGQEGDRWGFSPHFSDPSSGISSLSIGSSNVVHSTSNPNRNEGWHYPLDDSHDVGFVKRFLGVSENLAHTLVQDAKNDGRPHDITVARFRIKLPHQQKIDRTLLNAPASPVHEEQLTRFLVERMPQEMQQAHAEGHVDIGLYRDNDSTIAVVKTKPLV